MPIKEALTSYRTERQKAFDIANQNLYDPVVKKDAYYSYSNNDLVSIDAIHIILIDLIAYNHKEAVKVIAQNNQNFLQASKILIVLPCLAVILALILGISKNLGYKSKQRG